MAIWKNVHNKNYQTEVDAPNKTINKLELANQHPLMD